MNKLTKVNLPVIMFFLLAGFLSQAHAEIVIRDISPLVTTIGSPTIFTITGEDLPDGLGFTVGDCEHSNTELEDGTSTQRQFICTQYGEPGIKRGLVKDEPGGIVLHEFEVEARLVNVPQVFVNTNATRFTEGDTLEISVSTWVDDSESVVIDGVTHNVTVPANKIPYKVYLQIYGEGFLAFETGHGLKLEPEPLYVGILPHLDDWMQTFSYTFIDKADENRYTVTIMVVDDLNQIVAKDHAVFVVYQSSKTRKLDRKAKVVESSSPEEILALVSQENRRQVRVTNNFTCNHDIVLKNLSRQKEPFSIGNLFRKSLLVLQMGSSFNFEDRLQRIYGAVKGPLNIVKRAEKFCEYKDKIGDLLSSYESNFRQASNYSQVIWDEDDEEAVTAMFAIDFLEALYGFNSRLGVQMNSFPRKELKNAVLTIYNYGNKINSTLTAINHGMAEGIYLQFYQPTYCGTNKFARYFCGAKTRSIKLKAFITPVFTFQGAAGLKLSDLTKVYTSDWKEAKEKTREITKYAVSSHEGAVKFNAQAGLYLLKAESEYGNEVFRDTIFIKRNNQKIEVLIDR